MLCTRCHKREKVNNRSWCQACVTAYLKVWTKKNLSKVLIYRKKYRIDNKEKIRANYKIWYKKNGRKRDPLKVAAHALVSSAIKQNILERPNKCTSCKEVKGVEAHHNNYLKPLEVVWLCRQCHRQLHPGKGSMLQIS